MPRSVLALTFLGSPLSASSYQCLASSYRSARKYGFRTAPRVSASDGLRWAEAFNAAARDSSKGGCAWAEGAAAAGADAAAGGATPVACWLPMIQPTSTPKKMPATPNTMDSLRILGAQGPEPLIIATSDGTSPPGCVRDPDRARASRCHGRRGS